MCSSNKKTEAVPHAVDNTVTVPVPDVDCCGTDEWKILTVVVVVHNYDFYHTDHTQGTFNSLYTRNQFVVCKEKLLNAEDVSSEISLCEMVSLELIGGGQGYSLCCYSGCHLSLIHI